jgi:hypothetical protein
MSDFTTTTNFSLKKPTVGQAVDLWGTYLNSNFDEIDSQLQTLTVSIQTPDLEGLGNVLNTTPATNDFLRFNGESWAAATVSIPSAIDDLSDVDTSTTAPTTGQALVWSGSKWSPSTPTAATIDDGSITTAKLDTGLQTQIGRILVTDDDDTPTNGQILQYSTADTEWKYADLPGSTVVTLSDVNSASLADNALLVYNSSAGEFQFESGATLRSTLGVDAAGTDNSTDITISSATSYNYITISDGQVLTINQVDLQTDVSNTLPVSSGGTGSTTASAARTALGLGTIATQDSDAVTITGGNISGIVDLAIADGGTGASSVGAARTNLGLGSLATQDTITESQISDLQSYITASSTDTLTNKSGNISQWTNDSGYLTAETNNLSTVSGTLGTGNGGTGLSAIGTANQVLAVNTGATGLEFQTISITESQISDLQSYLTAETNDLSAAVTWANVPDANITQSSVTQHQAALSITESQISDLQTYLTAETNDLGTAVTGTLGTGNGGTGLTSIGTAGQVLKVNSGATALEFADESGGGGSGSSYIEHSSTVSDSLAISSGTNRMYIGNTAFSGSGTMAGYLVISHGYANFTGASALNVTGTLKAVS